MRRDSKRSKLRAANKMQSAATQLHSATPVDVPVVFKCAMQAAAAEPRRAGYGPKRDVLRALFQGGESSPSRCPESLAGRSHR